MPPQKLRKRATGVTDGRKGAEAFGDFFFFFFFFFRGRPVTLPAACCAEELETTHLFGFTLGRT